MSKEKKLALEKRLLYWQCIRRSEIQKQIHQTRCPDENAECEEREAYNLLLYQQARLDAQITLLKRKLQQAAEAFHDRTES